MEAPCIENKPVDKDTQKSTRKAAKEADAESTVPATIAEMPEPDRPAASDSMRSSRPLRRIFTEALVWDARLCQGRQSRLLLPERAEVGTRYATFGFNDVATWTRAPCGQPPALSELTPAEEAADRRAR